MQQPAADAYCQIQNLMGQFVQLFTTNTLKDCADGLFADQPEVCLEIPGGTGIMTGLPMIREQLSDLETRRRAKPDCGEFHLLHSPSCLVDEDLARARASWDTYSYHWQKTGAGCEIELVVTRLDAKLINVEGTWQYLALTWREMQSLLPWTSQTAQFNRSGWPAAFGPPTTLSCIDAADWLDIRNLQHGEALNLTDCRRLAISLQAAPVIVGGSAAGTAEGWWLVQTIHLEKPAAGPDSAKWQVHSQLGLAHRQFANRAGQWQMTSADFAQLADFSLGAYPGNRRYHHLQPGSDACLQVDVPPHCGSPADCQQIENLFSEWFSSLRSGKLDRYVTDHLYNEQVPVWMHIRSFGPTTPCLTTREAISGKLQSMDIRYVFKQTSHHCALSPVISVDTAGERAVAWWLDNNLTNLGFAPDTQADLADYMSFVALYRHEFAKVKGEWKHVGFEWEPLLSLPDRQYSQARSRGWAGSDSIDAYPQPAHLLTF